MNRTNDITRRSFLAGGVVGLAALSTGGSDALGTLFVQARVWEEARALVDAGAIGRPYYVGLRLPRGAVSFDDIARHVARVSYALGLEAPAKVSGSEVARDGFPADYMVSAKYDEGVMFSIATGPEVLAGEPYVMRGDGGTLRVYDSERPCLELEDDSAHGRTRLGA